MTTVEEKESNGHVLRDVKQTSDFNRGMAGVAERGLIDNIILHVIIRVKFLILTGFGLIPILSSNLSGYTSKFRPKNIPRMDWLTLFAIRMMWLLGATLRQFHVLMFILVKLRILHKLNAFHRFLMERIDKKLGATGYDWSKVKNMPLPEYDWQKGSPKEFYETFVKNPHPVVLRRFLKGTKMMEYTFDKIIERFGEEDVLLANASGSSVMGNVRKLKEVTQPGVYLNNSEVLFNKYPELWKALETERLEPYINKKSMFAQLFMGCAGTGTRIHSAHVWNFFHMIDGKKRWYFIDPTDWYYCYPMYFRGLNNGFHIPFYPDKFDEEYLPAFKYCPYYVVDIEPGDVMLNPAWWCHGIRNLTDKSVGIATRWSTNGIYGGNFCTAEEDYHIHRWASFNFLSGYKSFAVLHRYLKEINAKFDEHAFMTRREVMATRFKPKDKELFVDGKDIDGWRPIF